MSKRQEIRKQRQQKAMRNRLIGIGIAVLGLVLLLVLALPYLRSMFGSREQVAVTVPGDRSFPDADFNRLGSTEAPVTVIEFADYLCSHCQDYALNDEQQFIRDYVETGKVYYEYISVAFATPNQTRPIEATYCAGDQNAFWQYKDMVYANIVQTQNAVSNNYLDAYAEELGLDINAFNSCLSSGKYRGITQENLGKAREANIRGTPTFMVNGVEANRLNLVQVVESELAKTQ